jgi:outer membrane protein TolC
LAAALAAPAAAQEPASPSLSKPPDSPDRPTLELSLDQAVKRALESNAQLAVSKYDPEVAAQNVRATQGVYDPFLSAALLKSSSDQPQTNLFSGAENVTSKNGIWNFGLGQYTPTGANINVTFNNNKLDSNNTFNTFNPTFNSSIGASIAQPLLKNFKIDGPRTQIKIAKKNQEISDLQFRQVVINTVAGVKSLYYDLIYSIDNLGAARKSLDLAKKLLNENEIRVRVGTMAPLDIVQAKSEVASREEGVIVAEAQLYNAEDALKQALFAETQDMWALRVIPSDRPTAEPIPVDIPAAIQNAMDKRTDMVVARKNLERADISYAYAKNQTLPQLDLVASYGGAGVGGTQIRDSQGQPLPTPIPGGYGDATSQAFGFDFPTWRVGFNVSYAILNRSAKAAAASASINKEQTQASYRQLQLNTAVEVRIAGRAVDTNFKRVASTGAARLLAAERLDAEQKKFEAGMSTNFLVTQAQRDLTVAEVSELQAILDYRKSVTNFERVQEAGIGGSGGVATVSTGVQRQAVSAVTGGGGGF